MLVFLARWASTPTQKLYSLAARSSQLYSVHSISVIPMTLCLTMLYDINMTFTAANLLGTLTL